MFSPKTPDPAQGHQRQPRGYFMLHQKMECSYAIRVF
jgi:hypothetical protein